MQREASMTKQRFAIHPGHIMSRNDRQRHFVSYRRLIQLYGLDPRQCFDATKGGYDLHETVEGVTDIHPRYDGKYPEVSQWPTSTGTP